MEEKHKIVLLIGLPATGKTTYTEENKCRFNNYTIIRYDDVVSELYLIEKQKGYSFSRDQMCNDKSKEIDSEFYKKISKAVTKGENILIERINVQFDKRKVILDMAKASNHNYTTTAIVLHPPSKSEYIARFKKRIEEGHAVSAEVALTRRLTTPRSGEFDIIEHIG